MYVRKGDTKLNHEQMDISRGTPKEAIQIYTDWDYEEYDLCGTNIM